MAGRNCHSGYLRTGKKTAGLDTVQWIQIRKYDLFICKFKANFGLVSPMHSELLDQLVLGGCFPFCSRDHISLNDYVLHTNGTKENHTQNIDLFFELLCLWNTCQSHHMWLTKAHASEDLHVLSVLNIFAIHRGIGLYVKLHVCAKNQHNANVCVFASEAEATVCMFPPVYHTLNVCSCLWTCTNNTAEPLT